MEEREEHMFETKELKEIRNDYLNELQNLLDISEEIGLKSETADKLLHSVNNLIEMRYIFLYAMYCDECLQRTPKFIREAYGLTFNESEVLESVVRD